MPLDSNAVGVGFLLKGESEYSGEEQIAEDTKGCIDIPTTLDAEPFPEAQKAAITFAKEAELTHKGVSMATEAADKKRAEYNAAPSQAEHKAILQEEAIVTQNQLHHAERHALLASRAAGAAKKRSSAHLDRPEAQTTRGVLSLPDTTPTPKKANNNASAATAPSKAPKPPTLSMSASMKAVKAAPLPDMGDDEDDDYGIDEPKCSTRKTSSYMDDDDEAHSMNRQITTWHEQAMLSTPSSNYNIERGGSTITLSKALSRLQNDSAPEVEQAHTNFPVLRVLSSVESYSYLTGEPAAFMWSLDKKKARLIEHGKDLHTIAIVEADKIKRVMCSYNGDGRFFIYQSLPMPPLVLLELYEPVQGADFLAFVQSIATYCKVERVSSERMVAIFDNKEKELRMWHAGRAPQASAIIQQSPDTRKDATKRPHDMRKPHEPLHSITTTVSGSHDKLAYPLALTSRDHSARSTKTHARHQVFDVADFNSRTTRATRSRQTALSISQLASGKDETKTACHSHVWPWGSDEPLIYPLEGTNKTTVEQQNIDRLDEGRYLNDNLIQFYLRYLEESVKITNSATAKRILFMNPFFYERLARGKDGNPIDYDGVKRWTSKVDIFEYDYIIVPVNEQAHWYVAVVCNTTYFLRPLHRAESMVDEADTYEADSSIPGIVDESVTAYNAESDYTAEAYPEAKQVTTGDTFTVAEDEPVNEKPALATSLVLEDNERKAHPPHLKCKPYETRIVTMDSLGYSHSMTCSNLTEFIRTEAKARHNIDVVPGHRIGMTAKHIPEQDNQCDCGVFLLGYVECFLDDPDGLMHDIVMRKRNITNRFTKLDAPKMRVQIRQLILDLKKEQDIRRAAKDVSLGRNILQ